MNLKKLVRDCKELNVTIIPDDTYGYYLCFPLWQRYLRHSVKDICNVGIERRLVLGVIHNIRLKSSKALIDPLSSLERLKITESILEEL
jgi:hypothetical protein